MHILNVFRLFTLLALQSDAGLAAVRAKASISARIRQEEMQHSQILRSVHFFADLFGPRLTGSPNGKAAAEWAIKQMNSWGMRNSHLEPWNFGHPGWTNERSSGYIIAPFHDQLSFEVVAWTPGTKGIATAPAVLIDPPPSPTEGQLAGYLGSVAGLVRGRIVMIGKWSAPETDQLASRLDDSAMLGIFNPNAHPPQSEAPADPAILSPAQVSQEIDAFLIEAGAVVRIDDAKLRHGLIRAARNRSYDITKALPSVTLRNEDYGRVARILSDGTPVTMEFDIRNRSSQAGRISYNVIAEIPGTDKKDEIVMLGAHLDSWHVATGATDNAIGCAVMMEAARILLALDLRPRRTVRVALWSGEEEGLLGSQSYVAQHFGTAEIPGPEFSRLAAYINLDSGTGRVRGANVFGPAEAAAILRTALEPFADLGAAGAVAHKIRRLRGTDATTFSRAGLPAIGLIQDPIEYGTVTWHSNVDAYERVLEGEAREAAIVVAGLLYDLATRDEMLPRFAAADMPAPEGPAPVSRPVSRAKRITRAEVTDIGSK